MRQKNLLIAAAIFLAGCNATVGPRIAENVDAARPQSQPISNQSVVFGKVNVLSAKAPTTWTETDCTNDIYWVCPDSFSLVFLRQGDPKPITHRLTGKGDFAFQMAPGRYLLAEWKWHLKGTHPNEYVGGPIRGTFDVAPNAGPAYLGDITIGFHGRQYAYNISDNFEKAVVRLSKRQPQQVAAPTRAVIALEVLENGERRLGICAPQWGAVCDEKNEGVVPSAPKQSVDQFPVVADLRPTIAWRAVTGDDVAYDIAIYEAAPYGLPPFTRYIQGPLHEYAKDLKGPSYSLKKKLRPGARYFWSIRLRKGDVISNWSTMSYSDFAFFIVAFTSKRASHVPFRLQAPGATAPKS